MCHSNIQFKGTFEACLHSGNSFKGKIQIGGNNGSGGSSFLCCTSFIHFHNFRGQCMILARVTPHYLIRILSNGHKFCFLRTAWSGRHGACLCCQPEASHQRSKKQGQNIRCSGEGRREVTREIALSV